MMQFPRFYSKIVCTMGPSCQDEQTIRQMIKAGMTVARLNFSHGEHSKHIENYLMLRAVSSDMNANLAILCDIQGPKIRIGMVDGIVNLSAGDVIRVTPDEVLGNKDRVQLRVPTLLNDL